MEKLKTNSEIIPPTTELPKENDWLSSPWYQLYRMKWQEIHMTTYSVESGGPFHSELHKRGGGRQAWL